MSFCCGSGAHAPRSSAAVTVIAVPAPCVFMNVILRITCDLISILSGLYLTIPGRIPRTDKKKSARMKQRGRRFRAARVEKECESSAQDADDVLLIGISIP